MAKGSGNTRSSSPNAKAPAQTFEQQVDGALKGLRSEFFQRMEDFYDNQWENFQEKYKAWKEREDYIYRGQSSVSAKEADQREREIYENAHVGWGPYNRHYDFSRKIRDEYSDLTAGGYYQEGAKAPNFYAINRGEAKLSDANKAVKATAERNAEKKFNDVRAKMLKSTVDKGIDLKKASVRSVSGDGFLISDGKVTLHARYIMAWGEIKAPHFRFIITDRKS